MQFIYLAIKMALPTVLGNNNAIAYHANYYILCCLCFITASEALVPGHDLVLLDRIQHGFCIKNLAVFMLLWVYNKVSLSKKSCFWSFNFFKGQFFWRTVPYFNNSNLNPSSHFTLSKPSK